MPFPVAALIWVGGGAALAGVIAKTVYEDHSDHSDYPDAAERRRGEEEARAREKRENLRLARKNMQTTLDLVRDSMADAAGARGKNVFREWDLSETAFSYKDFEREFADLDEDARERVARAFHCSFDEEEKNRQQELNEINSLLQRIAQVKLTEK